MKIPVLQRKQFVLCRGLIPFHSILNWPLGYHQEEGKRASLQIAAVKMKLHVSITPLSFTPPKMSQDEMFPTEIQTVNISIKSFMDRQFSYNCFSKLVLQEIEKVCK